MEIFTKKSRLREILKNDKARLIIEEHFPGALANPAMKIALAINPSIEHAMKYHKRLGISKITAQNIIDEILSIQA